MESCAFALRVTELYILAATKEETLSLKKKKMKPSEGEGASFALLILPNWFVQAIGWNSKDIIKHTVAQ